MTQTTMHAISAPIYLRYLTSAVHILGKAAEDAKARKIAESTLLRDRLYPDMLPCYLQFFIAGDHAKGSIARLAGLEAPKFADGEPESFAVIQDRLTQVKAFIESVSADAVNGTEEKEIAITIPGSTLHMKGLPYLTGYAMPNFMFHLTTGYGILRKNGVPLGKGDFLRGGQG
jgi:hypothetical protein